MYSITAFIGEKNIIYNLASKFGNTSKLIILNEEIGMIPLTINALAFVNKDDEDVFIVNGYENLSVKMYSILLSYSNINKIGFIEAEYFSGKGSQSAVCLRNGKILTESIKKKNAINKLLKKKLE